MAAPTTANPWAAISGVIMRRKPHKADDKAYQALLQLQVGAAGAEAAGAEAGGKSEAAGGGERRRRRALKIGDYTGLALGMLFWLD